MTIRLIQKKDIPDVIDLHQMVLLHAGGSLGASYLHDKYIQSSRLPSRFPCWGAWEKNRLIGVISGVKRVNDIGSQPMAFSTMVSLGFHMALGLARKTLKFDTVLSHIRVMGYISHMSASVSYIDVLFVSPSAQGQGIGTKLVRRFEREMKAAGQKTVVVDTVSRTCPATEFYRRNGYVETTSIGSAVLFRKSF